MMEIEAVQCDAMNRKGNKNRSKGEKESNKPELELIGLKNAVCCFLLFAL